MNKIIVKEFLRLLPDGWKAKKLKEISEDISNGNTPSKNDKNRYVSQDNGILFIRGQNISKEFQLDFADRKYINYKFERSIRRSRVIERDLVITMAGSIGHSAVYNEMQFANVNQAIARIRVKENEINADFLNYMLSSSLFQKHFNVIKTVSAQPNISLTQIKDLQIPFPNITKQSKIVLILSCVDNLIFKTSAVIVQARKIRKSLMQSYFRPTDTNLCATYIKSYIKRKANYIKPREKQQGKYIGLEHIIPEEGRFSGFGDILNVKSATSKFSKGNCLYGKLRPYLKKVILATFDGFSSTDILVLDTIPEKMKTNYLYYLLLSHKFTSFAISLSKGTKMPRISWLDIQNFKTCVPSLTEQKKVVLILSSVDRYISSLMNELDKQNVLKKALMQKLLTGKIRVKK